jgi:prepilin-type processing-associated H-X9-DG protein
MNARLNGKKLSEIPNPARTVLLFEAGFGSVPAGGQELLPNKPRGIGGYVIGFVDGHVECVTPERLDELIWSP